MLTLPCEADGEQNARAHLSLPQCPDSSRVVLGFPLPAACLSGPKHLDSPEKNEMWRGGVSSRAIRSALHRLGQGTLGSLRCWGPKLRLPLLPAAHTLAIEIAELQGAASGQQEGVSGPRQRCIFMGSWVLSEDGLGSSQQAGRCRRAWVPEEVYGHFSPRLLAGILPH